MPYDCVVCVKQVPDTSEITAEAMKEDGTVNRAALPAICNPDDLHALEAALAVRKAQGGTVVALTMGPAKAADVLRECLFRGADRGVLITDRRAAASDTLATSYILAQAIRKIGRYDLIFCGRQAIDGDTAQVGPQCAEKLGIPQITGVERIEAFRDGTIRVRRSLSHGWEVVEGRPPLLLTVSSTANQPRPISVKRMIRFKKARLPSELAGEPGTLAPQVVLGEVAELWDERRLLLEQWGLDEIGAESTRCGAAGSPTRVHRIQAIVLRKEGFSEVAATEAGIRGLMHELVTDRTLG